MSPVVVASVRMFLAAAVAGLPTWAAALPLVAPKGTVAQDDGRLWKDGVKRTRDNQWVPGVILSGSVLGEPRP